MAAHLFYYCPSVLPRSGYSYQSESPELRKNQRICDSVAQFHSVCQGVWVSVCDVKTTNLLLILTVANK